MLYFYSGTDREKARAEMGKTIKRVSGKGVSVVRITDVNTAHDLRSALQGAGMFGESRAIVLEGLSGNEEMFENMLASLEKMGKSEETFFIFEEKLNAETRKTIEKYAEKSERYDAPKQKERTSIFSLANALKRADKKALWVGYQRELMQGNAPEAIHGVLFWGVKQMILAARENSAERIRAAKLVAELAELPHEARRNNMPLEYALERFVLSIA
ncbi:hypothetical protein A3F27_00890 [Candidatus Kaiserbacteria bacterium RIFCSPHIGHO2_12_FULL_53_13]|uniref:DNA polymerase III delta N-terminal domain-containing protein n=1 Tax=Candidatus Kaiserbacteria bacterium RIFCSPHIGHO2_12_FULL_53_13 TaxID=1798502 RepID=A0A1F6E7Q1_9BACT|nr:MAG: hypothetical protein A3F27_00890 [Candidatus Kaiserbacteria bacterium RIFCSPHIGHO2_12_FULL_53_13]OGG74544.1 MAG: hypothetical protein A3A37_01835 [Candidatus Kaiserbacteria bacterium RIFCSPLOWO2_01_FULL_52_36]